MHLEARDKACGVDCGGSDGAGGLDVVVDAREDGAIFFEERASVVDAKVFKVEDSAGEGFLDSHDEVVDKVTLGRELMV